MSEQEQRQAVIAEALTWIGTPFLMNAEVKGIGVDCAHLLVACYRKAGVKTEDAPRATRDWHLHTKEQKYLGILDRHCNRVKDPQPGDIAAFRFRTCPVFAHSGIVVNWPVMIHAMYGRKVEQVDARQIPSIILHEVIFLDPWGKK
jgi:cell wall-associated NlpC family hydrolase